VNAKEKRLAEFCKTRRVDGIWLRRRSNVAWLSDGASVHCDLFGVEGVASMLWTPKERTIFTDNIEAPRLRAEEFTRGYDWQIADWWQESMPPRGRFANDMPDDCLTDVRASLTPGELTAIRSLGRDTAEVISECMKQIRIGMPELQIAGMVAGRLQVRAILLPVLLVAADDRVDRFRHPIPTARRVRRKAMVAVCAQRRGLIVSVTRLVYFGKPPDALLRKHDAVCRVDSALHAATRPGARWNDVLQEGIRTYEATGFDAEWKLHHQGGPMGYACRDYKVTPDEKRQVQRHQAVGWNPSISGTKSEDTILSNGEILTGMPDWPRHATGRPDILVRRSSARGGRLRG
jgi:Xaa-Pro aminopeptidase